MLSRLWQEILRFFLPGSESTFYLEAAGYCGRDALESSRRRGGRWRGRDGFGGFTVT